MRMIYSNLAAALVCAAAVGTALPAAADPEPTADKVYFEDFSVAPGEDVLVELITDNAEVSWNNLIVQFYLPEGLTLVPITEADIDPEQYTLASCEPCDDGQYYAALSTNFANAEYCSEQEMEYAQKYGFEFPLHSFGVGTRDNRVELVYLSQSPYCLKGTRPISLLKLHADESLAEESAINFRVCLFMGRRPLLGETVTTSINGQPAVTLVRRVSPQPQLNTDVDGNGIVDIDDVNAVVNALLKK